MKRRAFVGALGSGIAGALLPGPARAAFANAYGRAAPSPRPGSSSRHFVERWSWAMGQPVHLQLFASSEAHGYDAAAAALAELRRVESRLTLFDDSSDLCELNRRAGRRGLHADRDLCLVLAAALRLEAATAGGFNPAVEPLMRAWGFRQHRATPPTAAEIREARDAVQAARVVIDDDQLSLPSSHTQLDLGGIGVGYGLDCAISVLKAAGIHDALLDISGDCFAIGTPPDNDQGWLVEIANPKTGGPPIASTRLREAGLATSSNSVSVVRYGQAIRGHVMDPETGWPAKALTQITVVARSGTEADALSTAMLVAGKPAVGVVRYFKFM
ncbi:MAG TPA: FAD:protein FMN transferase [Gemmatimonadales bacterium]|nr:FAD:protein FMN transferase [Gemmatimonadales bacterium]